MINFRAFHLFLVLCLIQLSGFSQGQLFSESVDGESKQAALSFWIGFSSTNWNDPGNWIGGVPDISDRVWIYNWGPYQPVITTPAFCNDIRIRQNASVTIANSALIISGDIRNNGAINASSGTLTFFGSDNCSVSGNSFSVDRLVVNKNSSLNSVFLNTDISVEFEMVFINGIVHCQNSEVIFLNGSDSRDGSSSSYIDGVVRKSGNDDFTFPIGNNGIYAPVQIEVFGQGFNEYSAQYFHANPTIEGYDVLSFENGLTNVSSCEYWVINHDIGSDLSRVIMSYEDERSCGTSEPWNLRVVRWDGSRWENLGSSGFEGNTQSGILKSGEAISEFSPFTLGSSTINNPLPVDLLDFDVFNYNGHVKIEWSTATETNCDYFAIERSNDLHEFATIGELNGAGNSTNVLNYELYDDSNLSGTWYYRLKQFDFDGGVTTYPPKSVSLTPNELINIYPNPAPDQVTIFQTGLGNVVNIKLYNSAGQLVYSTQSDLTQTEISLEGLTAGYYIAEVSGVNGILRKQFIKK